MGWRRGEGVVDFLVGDSVFSGAVCDLHVETRLPCLRNVVKVPLSK
jgi:hypothetical protein